MKASGKTESEYLVSAVISTYNAERFIRGCLEDLEAQTIADRLEIVVVDSGSQQNERAIVKEFQQRYNNIVYIRTEARESVYAAWNRGIQAAHGKYLTNANTDDRHKKDAFERMVAVLETRPDIALVYANAYITATENETFENHTRMGAFHWPDFDPLRLIYHCFMGPQPMWRKCMHTKHGYFDESFGSSGDWEFWLRMAETETFLHLDEFLGLYLNSPASVAHRNLGLVHREDLRVHQRYLHRVDRLKAAWQESSATGTSMNDIIWFNDFQVGQRLRIKGTPEEGGRFLAFEIIRGNLAYLQSLVRRIVPKKIKLTGTTEFMMQELHGGITKIDREKTTLEVNGFSVVVNARTMIGGIMTTPGRPWHKFRLLLRKILKIT